MSSPFFTEDNNFFFVSLTNRASEQLIKPLLDLLYYGDKNDLVLWELSSYPHRNTAKKIKIIQNLVGIILPEIELSNLLKVLRDFENYHISVGRREHFIHQFEVFLLGWAVIRTIAQEKDYKILFDMSDREVFKLWMMIALVHDLGQPLQQHPKIINKLATLYQQLGAGSIAKKYEDILKGPITETEPIPNIVNDLRKKCGNNNYELLIQGVARSVNKTIDEAKVILEILEKNLDHGYMSALILGGNVTFSNTSSFPTESMFKQALSAVALHNFHKYNSDIIKDLTFNNNPFAYFLFLIDNIQDWSRKIIQTPDWPTIFLQKFITKGKNIKLDIVLRHDTWPDKLVQDVKGDITNMKERVLQKLNGPNTSRVLEIQYHSNSVDIIANQYQPIIINL